MSLRTRLKRAFNAFANRDPTYEHSYAVCSSQRLDRPGVLTMGSKRNVLAGPIARIAMDCAQIKIEHCLLDEDGRYKEPVNDSLNKCFNLQANIDEAGVAFVQNIAESLLDEGCIAICPVDTDDAVDQDTFGIETMRVGRIRTWYPNSVVVNLYNDRKGIFEDVRFPKKSVAILTNPMYSIMNDYNSDVQRFLRKISLMDSLDEAAASGKLDIIIQFPYSLRSEERRKEAEQRKQEITDQLKNSEYGIAYIEANERITQLNRPAENTLVQQIEFLYNKIMSQLGLCDEIFNGKADDQTMTNYYTRIVAPIMTCITTETDRKFISDNARTRGHAIEWFRDPFKLVPVTQLPDIADKFTRNEILTSNEVRGIIGYKPSSDPKADELRNKNINQSSEEVQENVDVNVEGGPPADESGGGNSFIDEMAKSM